jgi:glycosyltransferase involved in cell wall biosynthesis
MHGLTTMVRLRPHLVHAHNPTSLHYATLGKLACRARVVMTDHGQGRGSARHPSVREWQQTDAVVAVSEAVAQRREIPAIRNKMSIIRNGIEPAAARRERSALRADLGLRDDAFVAIIVARIDGLKGHETLLRALGRVRDGDASLQTTLLVAGDGKERPAMEALASELDLGENWVRFLGFRSDAPDLLAASDLFILPSLAEGLPLSVLEAMAHGLPVIATPVGGVPEVVVPGQTGLLVPTEDPEALASAIAELISDKKQRRAFGAAGYERVLKEFSFEQMVQRYNRLYSDLRSNRKPKGR